VPGLLGRWLRAIGRILLFAALFIGLLSAGSLLGQTLDGGEHVTALIGSALMAVAALAAGALLIRRLDHRPAGALGLAWTNRSAREIGVGLAIGVGALVIAAIAMAAAGGLRYTGQGGDVLGWTRIVAAGFGGLAVAAFAEEVLFRGYPFQVLAQVAGGAAATLALSLLFALAHAGNPNVDTFALVNIFLAGVLLSVAYLRTRSLWFATAVHLGWNWAMALLFDLPVSGLELFDAPLYEPVVGGPRWFTGGAFGPEGGLVGSVAFGLALLFVLKAPGLTIAPELRALRPLGLDPADSGGGPLVGPGEEAVT
jgi:membrane protease YdiL (CAAX protease family)